MHEGDAFITHTTIGVRTMPSFSIRKYVRWPENKKSGNKTTKYWSCVINMDQYILIWYISVALFGRHKSLDLLTWLWQGPCWTGMVGTWSIYWYCNQITGKLWVNFMLCLSSMAELWSTWCTRAWRHPYIKNAPRTLFILHKCCCCKFWLTVT